jgi:hypothetical protein
MLQRKWEELLDQIERLFGFVEHTREEFPERRLTVEIAVFDGASGRMKLERTVRPVVLDKKTSYSKRIGGEVDIEYTYSDSEFADVVKLFAWDRLAGAWKQIELADLGR